jgi:hypothetical protein
MQPTLHTTQKSAADLNLQRRVALTLATLHEPVLRLLNVEAQDGTVTLSGRVASYYHRQLAQSRARHVAGVVRLIDALTVVERPASRGGGYAALLTRPPAKSAPPAATSLAAINWHTQEPSLGAGRSRRIA